MKDLIETLEEYTNGFTNVIAPPEEDVKELLEHIYNQDKEIERLNNIINELEKYTDEDDWTSVNGEIAIRLIKLKLQELKGDGSND